MSYPCAHCGKLMEGYHKPGKIKKYCSRECKYKNFDRFDKWTDIEIDALKKLFEKWPELLVVDKWNSIAKENGWRERSVDGMYRKRREFRVPLCSRREAWTLSEIAKLFNINPCRPSSRWLKEGLAVIKVFGRRHTYVVTRDALKKYASQRPKDFYGIPIAKLNFVFQDMKLSKEIFELAFADTRSQCFCIVRLQGGVFNSAGDCADKLVLGQATVEQGLKRESPIKKHGQSYDLVKLDYPTYLAPEGYEKEFNELAGNILIELYLQYKEVAGYSKLGIQIIAVRQAVNIALVSFRSHFNDKSLGVKERSIQVIASFWEKRYVDIYKWHFHVANYACSRKRITNKLKIRCYGLFAASYGEKAEHYFNEYVDSFISKYGEVYFRDQYLPLNYPQNKYVSSDVWLFIECLSTAILKTRKRMCLCRAIALSYIKANQPSNSYNPDWIDCNPSVDEESATSKEIKLIIEGLDCLNLDESYKELCNHYISAFVKHGNSYNVREELKITLEVEEQIIATLKEATLPF